MGIQILPWLIVSAICGSLICVAPWFVPRGPNRGVTVVSLLLTGICCWMFWMICYVVQMNPLVGPQVSKGTLMIMAKYWGDPVTNP